MVILDFPIIKRPLIQKTENIAPTKKQNISQTYDQTTWKEGVIPCQTTTSLKNLTCEI